MSKHYIGAGLAAGLVLALLAGALIFADQPVPQAPEQALSKMAPENDPAPVHASEAGGNSNNERDTRYQGQEDLQRILAVSLPASEYLANSAYGDFPLTLKGTAIPPLYLDSEGNLVQDKSAKDFIEYFISAAREEGTHTSLGRMEEYFAMTLPEPAQSQARALLDNYMVYRQQLDSVVSRQDVILAGDKKMAALREALAQRQALRRETLGEEVAQAMFGDSEKYETYAVNMLQTAQDESLTQEQKLAQIAQHEASLPPHIREKVRYKREEQLLQDKIRQLQQQGGQEAEIFALRKDFYGEKGAAMLGFMDESSDAWRARVSQFEQQKAQILASVTLSEQQKRRQVDSLRNQSFSEEEKLKLAWQALQ